MLQKNTFNWKLLELLLSRMKPRELHLDNSDSQIFISSFFISSQWDSCWGLLNRNSADLDNCHLLEALSLLWFFCYTRQYSKNSAMENIEPIILKRFENICFENITAKLYLDSFTFIRYVLEIRIENSIIISNSFKLILL